MTVMVIAGEDVLQEEPWVLSSENKLSRGDYHRDDGQQAGTFAAAP